MAPLTFDKRDKFAISARQRSLRLICVAGVAEVLKHSIFESSYSCIRHGASKLTGPFVELCAGHCWWVGEEAQNARKDERDSRETRKQRA